MTQDSLALRVPARHATLGGSMVVRRLLPSKRLRTVGAWCFLDHAGPASDNTLSVGPHPHIGLQTFTWMIEGEILHLDSLGFEQVIRAGEVNLMTAGEGISHVEQAHSQGPVHTVQFWIALPQAVRNGPASFAHYAQLPQWQEGAWHCTLLVGAMAGQVSPVTVHSPLVGLDLKTEEAARVELALNPRFEYAVVCLRGGVQVNGAHLEVGTLLYLGLNPQQLVLETLASDAAQGPASLAAAGQGEGGLPAGAAHVIVIGGEPLDEATLLWWNFVARTVEEVAQATHDWQHESPRFGRIHATELAGLPAPAVPEGLVARKNP